MDMRKICDLLRVQATEEQLTAGRYLESRGKRFCCDFGYENAVRLADTLFDEECENAERIN